MGVQARIVFDGGAYESSSSSVVINALTCAAGPYAVENVRLVGTVAYTNNPPNGAMRGFGAVQVAIGYEAQMDRLADACGVSPVEIRLRNAFRTGAMLPYGQRVRGPVATGALLERLRDAPLPGRGCDDPRDAPGGPFHAGGGRSVRRGIGYAAGFKNIGFSEGFDDSATARVVLSAPGGTPRVEVQSSASEVGQGVVAVQEQIAREELAVADVRLLAADTSIETAGAASSSRLTWLLGGAVQGASRELRRAVTARADRLGTLDPYASGLDPAALAELLEDDVLEATFTYRHRPTVPYVAGQDGDVHAGFAFVAHRAVVDVDVELGIARVVELVCAQVVGRAINPTLLEGQIEGGSIQGLGLALTEELIVEDGIVRTRSLGAYRIPTIVDAAPVHSVILELSDPDNPYGVKGAAELANVSSTPAILAALRDATGCPVTRAPARLEDLIGGRSNGQEMT
jgi:CO/xanthine dehydrogenase Mo-binding subunit